MAPSKVADPCIGLGKSILKVDSNAKMTTRFSSRTSATANMLKKMHLKDLTKRKAEHLSPPKGKTTKRYALVDITNDVSENTNGGAQKKNTTTLKKETVKIMTTAQPKLVTLLKIPSKTTSTKTNVCNQENSAAAAKLKQAAKNTDANVREVRIPIVKVDSRQKDCKKVVDNKSKQGELKPKGKEVVLKDKDTNAKVEEPVVKSQDLKIKDDQSKKSSEVSSSRKSTTDESSLYASALDTISPNDESLFIITPIKEEKKIRLPIVPAGVHDFDKENWDDPFQVSEYAMDIFEYLKSRENQYLVGDYLPKQAALNKWMRAVLVDWMVDVQEHFELCHETLYLAVKIMDLYLTKTSVGKESLQLVGVASLFVASKYDERIPPTIEEFLYMCENTYTREELLRMEMELFRSMDFCLGMPLSYRFLRRYARCSKTTMPVLTLARYILELALMEYSFVFASESKIACATLYLALKMKKISEWTPTLEYYSGYKKDDFLDLAVQLNAMLHRKPKEQLKTVRNKYSHSVFFEVAYTPLIENSQL